MPPKLRNVIVMKRKAFAPDKAVAQQMDSGESRAKTHNYSDRRENGSPIDDDLFPLFNSDVQLAEESASDCFPKSPMPKRKKGRTTGGG
jgi:hypothetical protein